MKPSLSDYRQFLAGVKSRVLDARIQAGRAINRELVLLYWDIGLGIVEKQRESGWGNSVVERFASDLRAGFPDMNGFSTANIWRMRQLFETCSAPEFLAQAARELAGLVPWGHHIYLLGKIKDSRELVFYLRAIAQFGWTPNILVNQVKTGAYGRTLAEKKSHNFGTSLPEHLASRLQQFILELGYGFCFVGRQYRLALGKKEYFVDLFFYHRFLKVLVAFDLKVGAFEPEHAGKMDFYLNLLNERERAPDDLPSIGIILCAEKDDEEVEFALKTKGNPIGVAEYRLQGDLPPEFKGKLPTAKQLADVVRDGLH